MQKLATLRGASDKKWIIPNEHHTQEFLFTYFEMLPHKWLEICNNKSTAFPFENHLQLLIMINKTRSLEITTDVSAIRHVVIFQANFGYAYL